ncbi:CPBP family intramembrane glutamic endopeptidase [Marinoscillum pacificum]|uniref:CPBP family intramembrane glutamic endopeptidase n=1 Tax=Marinoscillum pacificum TaxID=392723 RepID=UPI0021578799|nr:CPBP family intramembrane glutamic endopeptidase [Marinoscillum pacificum]
MQNILKNTAGGENSAAPWILLLILTGYIVAAFFAFSILSQVLIVVIYGLDLAELASILTNPKETEYARSAIMMMQAITSVGMFIITPLFFLYKNLHLKFNEFLNSPESPLRPAFMTILIMLCFMIANSIVIEWNQGIKMPESLSWFENWAQEKELQLEELTEYLTSFANIGQFLIALIVIAVIPAVGEELLFRGLIQNLLSKAFFNHHVGIWFAAILFGAMHMQFYGVVPRILLGALFGYLYYWSGSLSVAILGHFINNGLTLILLYLSQLDILDFDPTDAETSPPFYVIAIFLVGGSALLYLFKNYFQQPKDA